MVNLNEWIDLAPELHRQIASQLQQADSTLLGTVTEMVDATNVAVALDGVRDAQADVVCPGSGRMWVGARVRCIRDSSGRVVRVEAMAVDELPDGVETQDMDATTQWMASEQSAAQAALDEARAKLEDPETGLDAAQTKADAAVRNAVEALTAANQAVEDASSAVVLRVDSSRGLVFKNSMVSTVLSVSVFAKGSTITDIVDLHDVFGAGAFLEWQWRRLDDSDFGVISSEDTRIGAGGFTFTVSPADVDTKTVFMCVLKT